MNRIGRIVIICLITISSYSIVNGWQPTPTVPISAGTLPHPENINYNRFFPNLVVGRDYFYHHYHDKYGYFPQYIVWENDTLETLLGLRIGSLAHTTHKVPRTLLTFADIKPYVFWIYHEAGDTTNMQIAPITQIPDTTIVGSNYGIGLRCNINLRDLPLPKEKTTYIFYFESHKTAGPDGEFAWKSEPLFNVARSYAEDAIDSIQWARCYMRWTPQLVESILKQYPYSQELLDKKLNYALDNDSSCAVIKTTASGLVNSIQNRLDPMAVTQEYIDFWKYEVKIAGEEEEDQRMGKIEYLMYIIEHCKRPKQKLRD